MGLLQEENFPSYLRQYINHKSPDGIKDQHLFTTDSDNLKCIVAVVILVTGMMNYLKN